MADDPVQDVVIEVDDARLAGDLRVPPAAQAIVVFAHGSGSSRRSPRNRAVAKFFNKAGLATLLFDLLTEQEEAEEEITRHHRFNIPFLTERLTGALRWIRSKKDIPRHVGLFGSSTGAAAALAAATRDVDVRAVVSRGGRPDLADEALSSVKCPVLLIVGSLDTEVLELNREAAEKLSDVRIEIVPGATHLFSEPGTLERVAELARDWFLRHLGEAGTNPPRDR